MADPKRLAILAARVRVAISELRAVLAGLRVRAEPKSPGGTGGAVG